MLSTVSFPHALLGILLGKLHLTKYPRSSSKVSFGRRRWWWRKGKEKDIKQQEIGREKRRKERMERKMEEKGEISVGCKEPKS